MNTLAVALVWCIVQVTLMSLLAAGLYLVLRRLRPAAAAPIVLASLVMIVLLSLMAFSPWPRWTYNKLFQSGDESSIASGASIDDSRSGSNSVPGADRLRLAPSRRFEGDGEGNPPPALATGPSPKGRGEIGCESILSIVGRRDFPA